MSRLLLTTREAAALFGVKPATIRDWHRRGLVTKTGRNAWNVQALRAAQHAAKPRREPPDLSPHEPADSPGSPSESSTPDPDPTG